MTHSCICSSSWRVKAFNSVLIKEDESCSFVTLMCKVEKIRIKIVHQGYFFAFLLRVVEKNCPNVLTINTILRLKTA